MTVVLGDLVATSREVATTRGRLGKQAAIADLLARTDEDVELAVAYLTARPRQRRTGVSYRTLRALPSPADAASLTLRDVDNALSALESLSGPGSVGARSDVVTDLFRRATEDEQAFLRSLILGEIRQGALDGVMTDAIGQAAAIPAADVRRAAMLTGSLARTARLALREGVDSVRAVALSVGSPVHPMLATSATDVTSAMTVLTRNGTRPVVIDAKIDGVRAQVHKNGDAVAIYSRTLDDMTARLPAIVERVRHMPADALVLDAELVAHDDAGRPLPFQDVGGRVARHGSAAGDLGLVLFDLLHIDGRDLLDEPLHVRAAELAERLPDEQVERIETADPAAGQVFFDQVVAAGYEGVVVKDPAAPYEAGRRGGAWVKVKPVRTVDLVVLGVEWGSGRRTGKLSNIHLGARDPAGGFVMVGKTFKGMTDAMLQWQTERFLELERGRDGHVVWVRPEQVVEIAFDAVQRSRRYPGGVALRFARVLRYRDDKPPTDADSIDRLRALAPGA